MNANVLPDDRVNEIDLLRFLAAVSVVIFHYSFRGYAADGLSTMPYPLLAPFSMYGYLGVHLFFMISGFVILMTAAKGDVTGFVVSRIVRLYPAFWAACTLTFVAIIFFGAPRFHASVSEYLVNMTMLSGFVGVPSIDESYWSLFVEIKFYVLIAAVLALKKIHRIETVLVAWLLATLALEAVPVYVLRYVLITDYAALFIAGAICFLIRSSGISWRRMAVFAVCWGLALYQTRGRLLGLEQHFGTRMDVFVVWGIVSVFFIVMLLIALRKTGFFGRRQWLLAGAITYPLYLIHQNIGFMIFNHAYPAINAHLLLSGTIIFMILGSLALHLWIERPFARRLKSLPGLLPKAGSGRCKRPTVSG